MDREPIRSWRICGLGTGSQWAKLLNGRASGKAVESWAMGKEVLPRVIVEEGSLVRGRKG